jgi:hypothetical protein
MKNIMIAGIVALLYWNTSAAALEMADTIYHNGSILTMAGKEPIYVEALAVEDETIVFTGSKDQALAIFRGLRPYSWCEWNGCPPAKSA